MFWASLSASLSLKVLADGWRHLVEWNHTRRISRAQVRAGIRLGWTGQAHAGPIREINNKKIN